MYKTLLHSFDSCFRQLRARRTNRYPVLNARNDAGGSPKRKLTGNWKDQIERTGYLRKGRSIKTGKGECVLIWYSSSASLRLVTPRALSESVTFYHSEEVGLGNERVHAFRRETSHLQRIMPFRTLQGFADHVCRTLCTNRPTCASSRSHVWTGKYTTC